MTDTSHRLIMLKPMQTGVSGYARLQSERDKTWVQVNARGLACSKLRVFWYCSGGEVKELGSAMVNPRGEAALSVSAPQNRVAPERLQALLIVDGDPSPRPLLIGLCASQSAGSILDAKNASLSLCEKLARMKRASETEKAEKNADASKKSALSPAEKPPASKPPAPIPPPPPVAPPKESVPTVIAPPLATFVPELPREIFLPAVDPSPYITAQLPPAPAEALPVVPPAVKAETAKNPRPPQRENAVKRIPVDALERLRWPRLFTPLREHFECLKPCAVFDLPGWRFVCVSREGDGLWIGYWQRDGVIRRVAYAMGGQPAPGDVRPYQRRVGLDGREYRVLIQRAEDSPSAS
ncbi:MAG: hypothetical protein PHI98_02605 [Eubacteriales bacterium]|nr:hypothetical protein [Eubacteriales bacterium]